MKVEAEVECTITATVIRADGTEEKIVLRGEVTDGSPDERREAVDSEQDA